MLARSRPFDALELLEIIRIRREAYPFSSGRPAGPAGTKVAA
jgi:hypothetical protein